MQKIVAGRSFEAELVARPELDAQGGDSQRNFQFKADTFSYPNELVWEYRIDPQSGKTTVFRNNPPPTYAHHCFVVVRAAKQFFFHVRFDPGANLEQPNPRIAGSFPK